MCCSRKVAAKLAQVVTVPEQSPVGERRSNGDIECTVEEVEGSIRSVKSDLEHKQKIEIDRRHPILAWLPTYVADEISRHRMGPDGRIAEKKEDWKESEETSVTTW